MKNEKMKKKTNNENEKTPSEQKTTGKSRNKKKCSKESNPHRITWIESMSAVMVSSSISQLYWFIQLSLWVIYVLEIQTTPRCLSAALFFAVCSFVTHHITGWHSWIRLMSYAESDILSAWPACSSIKLMCTRSKHTHTRKCAHTYTFIEWNVNTDVQLNRVAKINILKSFRFENNCQQNSIQWVTVMCIVRRVDTPHGHHCTFIHFQCLIQCCWYTHRRRQFRVECFQVERVFRRTIEPLQCESLSMHHLQRWHLELLSVTDNNWDMNA